MGMTPETEFDTYEHPRHGRPPLVFHYAFNEGVEREVERGDGYVKTVRDGYHFSIDKITLEGEDVSARLNEVMDQDEFDEVVDFIEECLCGPPVPWPPEGYEGNWF